MKRFSIVPLAVLAFADNMAQSSRLVLLVILLLGSVARKGLPQAVPQSGDSVRVSAKDYGLEQQVAVLRSIGDGAWEVVVPTQDTLLAVPLMAVSRLERRGHKRWTMLGLIIGATLGGVVGSAVGDYNVTTTYTCGPGDRWPLCFSNRKTQTEGDVTPGVIATVIGAGVGALIGTMIRTPSWVAIDLPQRAPVQSTAAGAIKVGATWRF